MRRSIVWLTLANLAWSALAGERLIEFSKFPADQPPAGFESMLGGTGQPGNWRVILDPGIGEQSNAAPRAGGKVLAQLSQDETDERFPILLLSDESYGDFAVTTRFKMVGGNKEQMAGLVFRFQDTNNYYYVRASALGNTFRFIKVVNGQRLTTIGTNAPIAAGIWHELRVECKGNRILSSFNGQELIPPLNDNTFSSGRIGFWTKSDAVSYFGETQITFTPHETLAQVLVREALTQYPRLIGLRIYSLRAVDSVPKVIASNHADELGLEGSTVERDVIQRDVIYFGKEKKVALVTMPLHDRNGEVAGAVRLVLQSFTGQTEQNAVERARPIVKGMEHRIRSAKDLWQ